MSECIEIECPSFFVGYFVKGDLDEQTAINLVEQQTPWSQTEIFPKEQQQQQQQYAALKEENDIKRAQKCLQQGRYQCNCLNKEKYKDRATSWAWHNQFTHQWRQTHPTLTGEKQKQNNNNSTNNKKDRRRGARTGRTKQTATTCSGQDDNDNVGECPGLCFWHAYSQQCDRYPILLEKQIMDRMYKQAQQIIYEVIYTTLANIHWYVA